jgi:hypothetical protein
MGLNLSVMIGPGLFEAVRELLDRLYAPGIPDEKSCRRCA